MILPRIEVWRPRQRGRRVGRWSLLDEWVRLEELWRGMENRGVPRVQEGGVELELVEVVEVRVRNTPQSLRCLAIQLDIRSM